MTRARAHDEMGVDQLALDAPGHRQRRRRVVVTPDELDRASHRSDRVRVVLGERSYENVSHDAGGGAVVVRAVTLAERLDPFLAGEPVCGKEARDPEAEWRARPSPGGRCSGTPLSTRPAIRSGRLAARCTATRPPNECPSTTTLGAISSSIAATASAYSGVPHTLSGAGALPNPGRSRATASMPAEARTAEKSWWSRRHPCSARTQGVPLAVGLPEQARPGERREHREKANAFAGSRASPCSGHVDRPRDIPARYGLMTWRRPRLRRATWREAAGRMRRRATGGNHDGRDAVVRPGGRRLGEDAGPHTDGSPGASCTAQRRRRTCSRSPSPARRHPSFAAACRGLGLAEPATAGTFHAVALGELRRLAAERGRPAPVVFASKARLLAAAAGPEVGRDRGTLADARASRSSGLRHDA